MRLTTEVIALSREEFSRFVGFCNDKYGAHPIIIGGWAVDYYNPYYGSKDIDVVFEARPAMYDPILIHFFRTNGYEKYSKDILGLETMFRKKVATSNGVEFIDIDACSIYDPNLFHQHKEKELPYKLLTKNLLQAEKKGVSFTIPKLDLLFLYKLKAYADRDFETAEAETIEDVQYFTSKRDKDGADLIALADTTVCRHRLDPDKIGELAQNQSAGNILKEALIEVTENPAARDWYGKSSSAQIQKNFKPILDSL